MDQSELYRRYQGHFVDVRLKEEDEFIKTVFVRTVSSEHGQIKRTFVYADIVPDGDEEAYLDLYTRNPTAIQQIPLPESQIAEIKPGNKIRID